MKELKQTFSRYFNRVHKKRGTLWDERFKSVILEKGKTLVSCLAYIDLNPLRAGIVERPEDYPWNSIGYHIQTENGDHFFPTGFGIPELFDLEYTERFHNYLWFMNEIGRVDHRQKAPGKEIQKIMLSSKTDEAFVSEQTRRYRSRNRYFSDSGIIGSKSFIRKNYKKFKHHFVAKREKLFKTI